ncbi:MAG: hypothetical protein AAGA11_20215 [Pseudomonadota bacterium]
MIATAVPVLASLVDALTRDTVFTLDHLPPPRYSIKRVPGWIDRQSPADFPRADLLIDMLSVWPAVDVFPHVRLHNIGVVRVDAAQALIPGGERVALALSADGTPGYFWLDPANALLMLGIVQRDLVAYLEQTCAAGMERDTAIRAVKRNFDRTSRALRDAVVALDTRVLGLDVVQVAVDKAELTPLAQASLLPVVSREEALATGLPTLLISSRKPGHASLSEVPPIWRVWHVDDFGKRSEADFLSRWTAIVDGVR